MKPEMLKLGAEKVQYEFFFVPLRGGEGEKEALNLFLRTRRILKVDRQLQDGGWAFCVEWMAGGGGTGETPQGGWGKPPKVDYREKLPPKQFELFSKLRDARRKLAETEAVQVFTVMTNEQLAEMVTRGVESLADIGKIEGVGEARLKKYGSALLEALAAARREQEGKTEAASEEVPSEGAKTDGTRLARASRRRFARKAWGIARGLGDGEIGERTAQERFTALTAFTLRCRCKRWRRGVFARISDEGETRRAPTGTSGAGAGTTTATTAGAATTTGTTPTTPTTTTDSAQSAAEHRSPAAAGMAQPPREAVHARVPDSAMGGAQTRTGRPRAQVGDPNAPGSDRLFPMIATNKSPSTPSWSKIQ